MSEHEDEPAPREFVDGPPAAPHEVVPPPPLSSTGRPDVAAECACKLSRVRRDLDRAVRMLSETQSRLWLDDELAAAHLTSTEAERLDRFCLNVKVAIDELQRWTGLLTTTVESLAGRSDRQMDA